MVSSIRTGPFLFFCGRPGLIEFWVKQLVLFRRLFAASFPESGRHGHGAHPDVVQLLLEGVDSIDHPQQRWLLLSGRLRRLGGGTR